MPDAEMHDNHGGPGKGVLSGCLVSVYTSVRAGAERSVCVCNFSTGAIRAHWGKNSGNKQAKNTRNYNSLTRQLFKDAFFSDPFLCFYKFTKLVSLYIRVFFGLFFVIVFLAEPHSLQVPRPRIEPMPPCSGDMES